MIDLLPANVHQPVYLHTPHKLPRTNSMKSHAVILPVMLLSGIYKMIQINLITVASTVMTNVVLSPSRKIILAEK